MKLSQANVQTDYLSLGGEAGRIWLSQPEEDVLHDLRLSNPSKGVAQTPMKMGNFLSLPALTPAVPLLSNHLISPLLSPLRPSF